MRSTRLLPAFALLIFALPMLGATKDFLLLIEGIKVESKVTLSADFSCSTGRLQFQIKGTPPPAVTQICQARETHPSLVLVNVGADGRPAGERQQLESVTFTACQAGDGSVPTDQFSLNFAKCTTPPSPSRTGVQPNGTLTGLTPAPLAVSSERLTLNGSGATNARKAILFVRKSGADAVPAHTGQSVPVLTLELNNGQKWTFFEVKLEDVLISSSTNQSISFTYSRMTGPATGFQDSAR